MAYQIVAYVQHFSLETTVGLLKSTKEALRTGKPLPNYFGSPDNLGQIVQTAEEMFQYKNKILNPENIWNLWNKLPKIVRDFLDDFFPFYTPPKLGVYKKCPQEMVLV